MTHTIHLAFGSNLGDRQANLAAAIQALPPAVHVTARSPIYETLPWGFVDQPRFLNMVLRGRTALPPMELLSFLKELEIRLGRQPGFRNGPRLIDIDILLYGRLVCDLPGLTLPHPRLHERPFVLVPLADLAPHLIHPVLHRQVQVLLAGLDRTGVELFKP